MAFALDEIDECHQLMKLLPTIRRPHEIIPGLKINVSQQKHFTGERRGNRGKKAREMHNKYRNNNSISLSVSYGFYVSILFLYMYLNNAFTYVYQRGSHPCSWM